MSSLFEPDFDSGFRGVVERLTASLREAGIVTDETDGSVARTLTETFAREMAIYYGVLQKAYDAGFLDSAQGKALDNVVAILGVQRARPGLLRGRVRFQRLSPAPQNIVIPAGTRLTGPELPDGTAIPVLELVEEALIPRGQRAVSAAVQELPDATPSELAAIPPQGVSIMPRPLLGVESVSNPEPIVRAGGQEETDEHLRARARSVLREGQKGTAEAIVAAVRSLGIQTVSVEEAPDGRLGRIDVRIGDPDLEKNPGKRQAAQRAVQRSKAAGIQARVHFLRSVYFRPTIQVETADDLDVAEQDVLEAKLKSAVAAHINALPPGTNLGRRKLESVLLADPGVREVNILEMGVFLVDYDEQGNRFDQDISGKRQLPAPNRDWKVEPNENASIDLTLFPFKVAWLTARRVRLDMVVKIHPSGLTMEQAKASIKGTALDYVQRLESKDGKSTLVYADLAKALSDKAQVSELMAATLVHIAEARTETLKPGQEALLDQGERLEMGEVVAVTGA